MDVRVVTLVVECGIPFQILRRYFKIIRKFLPLASQKISPTFPLPEPEPLRILPAEREYHRPDMLLGEEKEPFDDSDYIYESDTAVCFSLCAGRGIGRCGDLGRKPFGDHGGRKQTHHPCGDRYGRLCLRRGL